MSLATRCIVCGTVFRVVQDQLKVSEGWVRCGKCTGVFNALEGLFDLDRDTPPKWPGPTNPAFAQTQPGEADVLNVAPYENASSEVTEVTEALEAEGPLVNKIDSQQKKLRDRAVESTPADRVNERDRLEFPDARFDSDLPPEDTPPLRWHDDNIAASGNATTSATRDGAPTFACYAQSKSWRHRPAVLVAEILFCGCLLIGLTAQAIHHFRDLTAARWTETAPLLTAWCRLAACALSPPRRIDDVVVESTALTRAPAFADAFQLSVVLRNRSGTVVARPSIELSLTDLGGRLVARRALSPVDGRAPAVTMNSGTEAAMQWLLTIGNEQINGYTVEVFYP